MLGLTEVRWVGCGGRTLSEDVTILYSDHEVNYVHGVGIMIRKRTEKTLMEWKPVNERIITARFVTRHSRLTIVQVVQAYAPTERSKAKRRK